MLLSFGEAMEREQVKDRGFFGTNKLGFTCEEILSTTLVKLVDASIFYRLLVKMNRLPEKALHKVNR